MGCRSLVIAAICHFLISMNTVCVATTEDENRYPTHQSQWSIKKHNNIYPHGLVTSTLSACMGCPRPSVVLSPGHTTKSLEFK